MALLPNASKTGYEKGNCKSMSNGNSYYSASIFNRQSSNENKYDKL